MAFPQPFQGKPSPKPGSMFFDGKGGIFRTTGEKPAAMASEGAKGCLVEADEKKKEPFHASICYHSSSIRVFELAIRGGFDAKASV
jgi:hypothetical protein